MKRSLEKATAVAAGAVLLAGCESSISIDLPTMPTSVSASGDQSSSGVQETVYVTADAPTVTAKSRDVAIVPSRPSTVDVYRMKLTADERENISNQQITDELGAAALYLSYDTDGYFSVRLGEVSDLIVAPSGIQEGTDKSCYTVSDIFSAGRRVGAEVDAFYDDRVVQLVSNEVDVCRSDDQDDPEAIGKNAVAFAKGDLQYYSVHENEQDKSLSPQYKYGIILHETGHSMDLNHFPEIGCPTPKINADGSEADDNLMLRDVKDIVADDTCGPRRNADDTINPYASSTSIMGEGYKDEDSRENSLTPAFSNLDRATLLPDVYTIKTVEPIPGRHRLEYGKGQLNGIVIELTKNHPLKEMDGQITKLVIMNEATNGSIQEPAEGFVVDRDCEINVHCNPIVVATNDDYSVRYVLEKPDFQIAKNADISNTKKVIYMDSQMNFGIIVHKKINHYPEIEIVDYEAASNTADQQQRAFEEFNDSFSKSDSTPEH